MPKRNYKSCFSACVKVRPKQLNWLKENKDTRTVAGFLDKIINERRNTDNTHQTAE